MWLSNWNHEFIYTLCFSVNDCSVKESCDSSQYGTQYADVENKLQKNDPGMYYNIIVPIYSY